MGLIGPSAALIAGPAEAYGVGTLRVVIESVGGKWEWSCCVSDTQPVCSSCHRFL